MGSHTQHHTHIHTHTHTHIHTHAFGDVLKGFSCGLDLRGVEGGGGRGLGWGNLSSFFPLLGLRVLRERAV
jgi:hypothetical protein